MSKQPTPFPVRSLEAVITAGFHLLTIKNVVPLALVGVEVVMKLRDCRC
jgi:hypothetical protein